MGTARSRVVRRDETRPRADLRFQCIDTQFNDESCGGCVAGDYPSEPFSHFGTSTYAGTALRAPSSFVMMEPKLGNCMAGLTSCPVIA